MAHSSSIKLWSFYTDDLRRVEVCKIEMSHLYWEWGEGDNVNEWCNLLYFSLMIRVKSSGMGTSNVGSNSSQCFDQAKAISRRIWDSLTEIQLKVENNSKTHLDIN